MRIYYDEDMAQNTPQTIRRLQIRSLHGRGRKRTNADSWLTALETRYAENMRATGQIMQAMAHEPDRDSRGTVTNAALGVNATETRYSERWLGNADPTKDYGCYSIMPDGSRKPFEVPQPDEDRKPRQSTRKVTVGKVSPHKL